MSDFDPLEQELAGLLPTSPSPNLKWRIAAQLDSPATGSLRASWWLRLGLAGALVAAVATGILLWPRGQPILQPDPSEYDIEAVSTFDAALPSLWSYRNILTGSSFSQDELFDRYPPPDSRPANPTIRAYPSIRFDFETDPFPGDF